LPAIHATKRPMGSFKSVGKSNLPCHRLPILSEVRIIGPRCHQNTVISRTLNERTQNMPTMFSEGHHFLYHAQQGNWSALSIFNRIMGLTTMRYRWWN
jgi:hypothetical protein